MRKLFLLILIILSSQIQSQTICDNGSANSFPCNDYDLMSQISLATMNASDGNDSWGWTDTSTGKEYAIIGLDNGTAFIDISDPVNPIYLGKLPSPTPPTSWRDIKVYQNHAYVVSDIFPGDHNHGMQVFDLTKLRSVTNPPQTFAEDGRYTGFGKAHNIVINEDTGFAYAVGTLTFSGGPHFINLQDPKNPVAAGGFVSSGGDPYSHDAQVVTYNGPDTDHIGKEILIGSNQLEIVIADITNKANPITLSTINYSDIGYTHQGWFTEDHRYFLLGDEFDESNVGFDTRTIIFDFEDLDNPKFHMNYTGPTPAIDHNGYVKGNKFFLANYRAGLRVIDIADIANKNIFEIGSFDSFPSNNNAGFNGAWSVYPYFDSGNIVISDIESGFLLVRQSNTLSINDFSNKSNFAMYPNPTKSGVTIDKGNTSQLEKIEIYNILGEKMKEVTEFNDSEKINLTLNYAPGIYLVRINNSTKKLIIN
ncbi:choice-of-anchor B family protein [Aquimarina sp. 2201CG14-23]|uniref:choice-of-anchor B family protein n=1 Tax=Aquimarina mycalae TaxID=3040073 RepID=UPI002477D878|nr:choice-of-anchor B family protein [Aquimarina sp. 2201CG14-23]MDH7446271.1 choice-of-anchor B family protein [Aquimarina sp. 2201CG14-23]